MNLDKINSVEAIALEGGAMLGQTYTGFKQRLEVHGIEPRRLAGTSAGAINALLWTLGLTAAEQRELQEKTDWSAWARSGAVRGFFRTLAGRGINSIEPAREWLTALLEKRGLGAEINFRDLATATGRDLTVVVTRFVQRGEKLAAEPFVISAHHAPEVKVREAVLASMAIPLFYPPIPLEIAGKVWRCIDGGVSYNHPIDVWPDLAPYQVLGCRIDTPFEVDAAEPEAAFSYSKTGAARALVEMLRRTSDNAHVTAALWPRVVRVIVPRGIDAFDFEMSPEKIEQLVAAGAQAFDRWLAE